ncbi:MULTISPECIES: hypothetical protein [Pontibacillus]|uniref:Uncharacterized protein n=1 Tax=Pontibacillus chungwhensis TaxID=265426 RepID=A0ABY8V4D6_9BACI|nr:MULTISPECIES: hypothetical protein [Pontibacillus]MCD5326153.1 hypothetical protein [Pontibacillus sp. HN14]WIG00289.1 hypothetical protein QNI29_21015 [Pontibacillus chungwhensis]
MRKVVRFEKDYPNGLKVKRTEYFKTEDNRFKKVTSHGEDFITVGEMEEVLENVENGVEVEEEEVEEENDENGEGDE